MSTWWLETAGAVRRRVDPGGVTLGRSPRCDVVLSSEHASRVHAIVHLAAGGPRLVQLGRSETRVLGAVVEREHDLASGDTIEVPGLTLKVVEEMDEVRPVAPVEAAWVIERADGGLFGVSRTPFVIGASPQADLRVDALPEHALELRSVDGMLEVHASGGVEIDGEQVAPGEARTLARGSTIACGGERFTLIAGGALGAGSTIRGASRSTRVVLEFLPRGGRLVLTSPSRESAVYLPDRRCDLVAVLLAPPDGARAGDFVPDEVVLARVWGKEPKGRADLNVLVYRLRKDLAHAGLDGALIERAEGGGATRFVLAPGAVVELG